MANKMFVHYGKTKAEFIAAGLPNTYNNSIVFIKGDANGNGSCIYTHGTYFANFTEFIAKYVEALNYVKGVNVSGTNYNAAAGGGYLAFAASDPSTVAVNADRNGITIGLTPEFINTVSSTATLAGNTSTALGSKADGADAEGSAFARIAKLAAAVAGLQGSGSGSVADQIKAAINELKGTFDADDATTLAAINDELDLIDAKWSKYVTNDALSKLAGGGDDGELVNVSVTSKGGEVTSVVVSETALTNALAAKANASEVYKKSETYTKEEVGQAISTEVAKIINDNDDTSINTLQEIAAWIAAHPESVAAINKEIGDLKTLVGTTSVASQIDSKIETLNYTDEAETNKYVSAVTETNGVIKVSRESLPTYTLSEGSENGTVSFNGTNVKVHGLGSAAYTASTAYATSTQGTKADNALQEITKTDSDYATITICAKSNNKQNVKVDIKVKAVAEATAAKQGFADAYSVKTYVDDLFAWEEID